MSSARTQWLLVLLIAPFVKGCVYPGWSSALELALVCGLVAFLSWFRPEAIPAKDEITALREEIRELRAGTQEQIKSIKLRVGFRDQMTG
jgi:hypothetical protein